MEAKLNQIYGEIANKLNSIVPVKWDTIYLLGEVAKEQSSYMSSFYYIESENGDIKRGHDLIKGLNDPSHEIYSKPMDEVTYMILELNNCFKEEGQELWERVSLKLENTGAFSVEFFYDVMHKDDGGGLSREVVWAHKTFGFTPAQGTYLRKQLDIYIDKNP